VIGTASAANADDVPDLGVDEMIDDQTTRFDEVVGEVDVVFDTVGGETRERCWDVLKRGGHLVSILGQPAVVKRMAVRCGRAASWFDPVPAGWRRSPV